MVISLQSPETLTLLRCPTPLLAVGLKKTFGTLCHQSDHLSSPAKQVHSSRISSVLSAKDLIFSVNPFFRLEGTDQFTLSKNGRHAIANALTMKSGCCGFMLLRNGEKTQMPGIGEV
jgi:hypothetical protein